MIQVITFAFDLLLAIITQIIEVFGDFMVAAVRSRRKTVFNADFGKPEAQLNRSGNGFYIGEFCTTEAQMYSHLICFGGTGSYKTSSVCIPILLHATKNSYVIHDPAKQAFNSTASHLAAKGYKILQLNYDDYTQSCRFNVLQKCRSETDVYQAINVITKNIYSGTSYDYWAKSAEDAIGFFAFILFSYAEPQYINLANVAHMIEVFSFGPEQIDTWLAPRASPRIINKYKSLIATPEKTLQSTLATAKSILQVYQIESFATITCSDEIDFSLFSKQKCALFICGSPKTAELGKGISASLFDSFFAHLMSHLPESDALGITFLLDEASLMTLSLSQVLSLGRKHKIAVASLWQNYNQIIHKYGTHEAENIYSNNYIKAFMPSGQALATCRMISELLGKYTYIDEFGKEKNRELLNPQEIFQLDKVLVLQGNKKPLLLNPSPYFENPRLLALTKKPIYTIPPQNRPPLSYIQF